MPNKRIILDSKNIKVTALEHLKKPGEIKNALAKRLNETLKTNLHMPLERKPESKLTKLIEKMKPVDFGSDDNKLTLKKLADKTIKKEIGDDKELKEEYEEYVKALDDKTKLKDLFNLDKALDKNPIFTDIVKDSRLHGLFQVTKLKNKPDKTEKLMATFEKFGGANGGFWKTLDKLEKDKTITKAENEDIKTTFELAALTLDNTKLVNTLKKKGIKSFKDLISYDKSQWLNTIKENNISVPENITGDNPKEIYANHLEEYVTAIYPTPVFFDRALRDDLSQYKGDLKQVAEFFNKNKKITLAEQIDFRKVKWYTRDTRVRNETKKNIEDLRKIVSFYSELGLEEIIRKKGTQVKVSDLNNEIKKLEGFWEKNQDLDLQYADFHPKYETKAANVKDRPKINWGRTGEKDKKKLRSQLKVYQRLFRLHPRFQTVETLLEEGFDSARKITLIPEKQFVKKCAKLSNPDFKLAEKTYKKALGMVENTTLQLVNVKNAVVSRYNEVTEFNNIEGNMVEYYKSFQSYQDMFGSLNFCACEDCNSISSPAAYFVDLMRFIDMHVTEANQSKPAEERIPEHLLLKKRRPDLWTIPLDCENTKREIPYLDIVNDVLETRLSSEGKPYEDLLLEAKHPFNLPFNLPLEQIRIYLSHFKKDLSEIYEVFKKDEEYVPAADMQVWEKYEKAIYREYLQISQEELKVLTESLPDDPNEFANELGKRYGIDSGLLTSEQTDGLARVENFMHHTGLSRKEVNELLFQNLSDDERKDGVLEQKNFFINNVNDGEGPLDVDKVQDEADPDKSYERILNLSNKKLDRIHRFIRLSRKLGWSFEDLDWVLRSIQKTEPDKNVDKDAIVKIAKIKKWKETYKLPLDVLCNFWYDIKNIGQKNPKGPDPQDLFNRVFNNPDVLLAGELYDLNPPKEWKLDDPDDKNRSRLLAALEIYDEDLMQISRKLTDADPFTLNHGNLSRLYRFAKIPKMLELSIREFMLVLELMKSAGLIDQEEIKTIDDLEKVIKIVDWIKESKSDVYEVHYILTRELNEFIDPGYADKDVRLFIEDLYTELRNGIVVKSAFATINGLTEVQSESIFNKLVHDGFLREVETGGVLTDAFQPDNANFTLGLPVPLDAHEKDVIKILRQYKREVGDKKDEKKIVLEKLGVFFGRDPALLRSVIDFTFPEPANQRLDKEAFLERLLTPVDKSQYIPEQVSGFFRSIHARLFLVDLLKLNQREIDSITGNREYYTIDNIIVLNIKDMKTLFTFKELVQAFNAHNNEFIDYFEQAIGADADEDRRNKKAMLLAEITDWEKIDEDPNSPNSFNKSQLKVLFDRFWPSGSGNGQPGYNNVKGIEKLKKCFDLGNYLGVGIDVIATKWLEILNEDLDRDPVAYWETHQNAARSALEVLKAKYSEVEWEEKFEPLNNKIRELKRDALSSYAIWNIDKDWPAEAPRIKNLRDLYAYLLIDVEMTSCQQVSRLKEGLNSLQLYVERCQMNLEDGVSPEDIPENQWKWMKNYRVWEANRKVFLYPENYIMPELRDNKSPIFKELEDELMQSEITKEAVGKAYNNYLDKFSELANLKIAGSYFHSGEEPETKKKVDTLYLFGRTNTQPYIYYYRKYINEKIWTPWEKVNLSIKSKFVSPVFAFGKLFVFWVDIVEREKSEITNGEAKPAGVEYNRTIKYSFYNFNKNWTQPQTLSSERLPIADYSEREGFYQRVYPYLYGSKLVISYSQINANPQTTELSKDLITPELERPGRSIYIATVGDLTAETTYLPVWYYNIILLDCESTLLKQYSVLGRYSYDFWLAYYRYYDGFKDDRIAGGALLEKICEFGKVKFINQKKDWTIFDNGDEEFLIKRVDRVVFAMDEKTLEIVTRNPTGDFYVYGHGIGENGLDVLEYVMNKPEVIVAKFDEEKPITPSNAFRFLRISTNAVHELSLRLFAGGVDSLLSIESQQTQELDFNRLGPKSNVVSYPYPRTKLDFNGAYGLYYREIFFHTPFLVACGLNANQKWEDAQKWFHYIYNPTISKLEDNTSPENLVWRYLGFRDLGLDTLKDMLQNEDALDEYHANPFQPHAVARLRLNAYQKAVVMKYIDNLLDWGDFLFEQYSWESITEATMLYVLAYNLLGPRPEKLDVCERKKTLTYEEIINYYRSGEAIPEFLIELENAQGAEETGEGSENPNNDINPYYFCIPENKDFVEYWDRVEDRLYNIRHCMNIKGVVRELALFQPPISPMALVRAFAAGRDTSTVLSEIMRPLPYYRFSYLIEKAKSLASTVQQLGSALLSALEKKDAEELSLLRSTHEKNILKLTEKIKEKQKEEATESHAALLESQNSAKTRNQHYKQLIEKGLSKNEQLHLASMMLAWYFDQVSNMMNVSASIAHLVPNVGSALAMTYGGREVGESLKGAGEAFKMLASFTNLIGSMSSTLGSYERRKQDWELQEKLSQHDIDQMGKQINAAEIRVLLAEKDIEIHEKNIQQTEEVYELLRDKFSNKDLYQWMVGQLSGVYFQTYKLAYDYAKSAEKAYQFERNIDDTYINFGHWDSLKKGLLAGERLMLELNQLEKAYLDDNKRTFEIEKTISLAQINPIALFDLKKQGKCEFELKEELFDYDFPGHYCRKIKTISISVPAVVGPYESIKATLAQKAHKTLMKADTSALLGDDSVKLNSDSINVRSGWREDQQIAISKGVNDSGMFELNFRDERYLPFEGTGAVSTWKLEMPKATNAIDFDSISDVIINLKYTSLFDGGLKENVIKRLKDKEIEGHLMLSLRHEFSSAWHRFMNPNRGDGEHILKFTVSEKLFQPNLKNKAIKSVYMKLDFAPDTLPLPQGSSLDLSLKPASATTQDYTFNGDKDIEMKELTGGGTFGDWTIAVERKSIPPELRKQKKDDSGDEVEPLNNEDYYYLDPEKVKNIGLILVYEGDVDWPEGN